MKHPQPQARSVRGEDWGFVCWVSPPKATIWKEGRGWEKPSENSRGVNCKTKDSHKLWRFFHCRWVSTLPPETGRLSNCPDQQHVGHDTGHFPGLSVGLALPLPVPWSIPFWSGKPGTIVEIQLFQDGWAGRSQATWGALGNQMRRGTETRCTEAGPEAGPQAQPTLWPPPGSTYHGFPLWRQGSPCVSCPVVSDSLWPRGLQPAWLPHPWDSPGKNTRVGCHALLQGIFPTEGSNPGLLHCRRSLLSSEPGNPSGWSGSGTSAWPSPSKIPDLKNCDEDSLFFVCFYLKILDLVENITL